MSKTPVFTMKRIQFFLAIAGALTLAIGAVLIATDTAASPSAIEPGDDQTGQNAVYVGSNTCFTCHPNEILHWDAAIHTAVIQDPVVNPAAALADFNSGAAIRQLEINGETRAYTAQDIAFIMNGEDRQRYVMRTEDGFALLPGQWNSAERRWINAEPSDWLGECAGCHTTGFSLATGTFVDIGVTCEACHGPASTHVELASTLSPESSPALLDQIRQSISLTVDAAVCAQCHVGSAALVNGPTGFLPAALPRCPELWQAANTLNNGTLPVVSTNSNATGSNRDSQ
jgi:hypothetical protein